MSISGSRDKKCVVHQVRNSLNKVSRKYRKELAQDMKRIYKSPNEKTAEEELERFIEKRKKEHH